ncbi:FAD binding domain-containing protein [Apodospora peruviana]|uniref:FAD binding domain-containing protein n=1 Tax=Apodospora peruviana TaxID=516989 RepID=A0AAE0M044_9PEZI|nr:FAD binding domain-containing protein [Apodospora peruviana]
MSDITKVEFLIIGAGPAGASLACFLGQNGLKGIMISSAPGTADTPRAHLINPFTVECLADIGLDEDVRRLATTNTSFRSIRWAQSMAGTEYGRVLYWGGHPDTARDTATASPYDWCDLPQPHMEPLLVKYASHNGFDVRFNTKLISLSSTPTSAVICTLHDLTTGHVYRLQTKFLFGADGGRSSVARSFGFTFNKQPSQGTACNILFRADLTHVMTDGANRSAQLHGIANPVVKGGPGQCPTIRMVRPFKEWLLVTLALGVTGNPFSTLGPQTPGLVEYIKQLIGDETVDVTILRVDPWAIRETVAERYSNPEKGNVFLLGDAAHLHPPTYGLGSNTCVQDAYNLAWKVAYVAKGWAGPGLLESYTIERQPVGAKIVKESNEIIRRIGEVWQALGTISESETPEEGVKQIGELSQPTVEGEQRRRLLHDALEGMRKEGESLGITMNQWYDSGSAVYLADETQPRPTVDGDENIRPLISTYPGMRLPHAWLDVPSRRKEISTQHLAGHGAFCLFIGHGGGGWRAAAGEITKETGIPIRVYGVGAGLDYHDVYREWRKRREVEEEGCVLVRPDRFVAWRSMRIVGDCTGKLRQVLDGVLSREETHTDRRPRESRL